ncbi:hypothetical protein TRFO_32229 [Tritrichomonas foetus]|uniref:Raptor N-terminal CASPase-like domain-containing protein n=1 Tax=Tritrichomonas foetus TaxID=1144522 RepID=A0A1J4JUK4_9EUKA|nr:hypothetical protein TRFO_32229 [Tritrichomonas foetus]|eukprot:OHT00933.1 hypothetical protein TRFO_32229 [Tritrichomonas foetus]
MILSRYLTLKRINEWCINFLHKYKHDKENMQNTNLSWKEHLDNLIESESSTKWKPFPERYLSLHTDKPVITRQISTKFPSVHVIAKITEDFASETSVQDDESIPSKVFCWRDVSTLSLRVAFKTVRAGLEREYRNVIENISFDIKSFSSNDHSSNLPEMLPDYLIYHIIDPSLSQSQVTTRVSKLVSSYSNNKISSMKRTSSFCPTSIPSTIDSSSLTQFCESISRPAIFIFDCPNAIRLLNTLRVIKNKDFFILGASSGILPFAPHLPYDLFTSCLLTPARVALLIQTKSYEDLNCGVLSPIDIHDLITLIDNSSISEQILNCLEHSLDHFADRIALESLENNIPLFEQVFRRDPLVAKMFYHFIFACRMMKFVSSTPVSYPALPDMTKHPLWETFDLQVDRALYSLRKNKINSFSIDSLLGEQMMLLESWLSFPAAHREMPDELSSLAVLLDSTKYFERAIKFIAQFLSISATTTEKFLNTRAFPVLLAKIPKITSYNKETAADFSFSVAASILLSPSLRPEFDPYIYCWNDILLKEKDHDNDAITEQLIVSCFCCLLQFEGAILKMNCHSLDGLLNHTSARVRTLTHLLFKKMHIPLELPLKKVSDEDDPLCRAALVSRIAESINEENKVELFFDLILSLSDPFSLTREEAIIALGDVLRNETPSFFEAFSEYLKTFNEDQIRHPIVQLLSRELEILTYDPSKRVQNRFSDFLQYLLSLIQEKETKSSNNDKITTYNSNNAGANKICIDKSPLVNESEIGNENKKYNNGLESNLLAYCLSTIVHYTTEADDECNTIAHTPLSGKLIGIPAVSPSGLLSCGDSDGIIHCQTPNMTMQFDFFNQAFTSPLLKTRFDPLLAKRVQRRCVLSYEKFIDDEKLLAVSNTSQVIVIDTHSIDEPSCSFWMEQPDICDHVMTDYNYTTFKLISSSFGRSTVSIFDLEKQKKTLETRIERDTISCLQWMQPFSSLFFICQKNFSIYDERVCQVVTSALFRDPNDLVVGCNAANAMPMNIIIAKESGELSMIDLRIMREVTRKNTNKPIKMFDIHRQLPFGFGLVDNTAFSVSFDSGALSLEMKEFSVPIHSFALHMNEAACVVRTGSRATYLDIRLD